MNSRLGKKAHLLCSHFTRNLHVRRSPLRLPARSCLISGAFLFSLLAWGPVDAEPINPAAALPGNRLRIQEIARQSPSDAEALIRLFEDAEIVDDGTIPGRIEAILLATGQIPLSVSFVNERPIVTATVQMGGMDLPVPIQVPPEIGLGHPNDLKLGVPFHKRIFFKDRGFNKKFRDGSNQVGHFLTAVRLGYDPAFILNPFVQWLLSGTKSADDAVRIMIGYEQVGGDDATTPLDPFSRFAKAIAAPSPEEVEAFKRGDLEGIRVGSGFGRSREDLRLSHVGWTFGKLIGAGHFKTKEILTAWLRTALI